MRAFRRRAQLPTRSSRAACDPLESRRLFAGGLADGGSDLSAAAPADAAADTQQPTLLPPALAPLTAIAPFYDFDLTWADDVQMDAATITAEVVTVVRAGPLRQGVTLLGVTPSADGKQVTGRFRFAPPAEVGVFDGSTNGPYWVEVWSERVKDAAGNHMSFHVPSPALTFTVAVPMPDGPDLHAAFLEGPTPPAAVAGGKTKARPLSLGVVNHGNAPFAGPVTLRVVASTDFLADAADAVVAEVPVRKLSLAPNAHKIFRIRPTAYPMVAEGDYRLLGVVDDGGAVTERLESNNAARHAMPVRIAAPFVDLEPWSPVLTGRPVRGRPGTVVVTLRNDGNIDARGVAPVRVRLTSNPGDPAGPFAITRLVEVPTKLKLKAGTQRPVRVRFLIPDDLPEQSYYVVVELPPGPWSHPDPGEGVALSPEAFFVSDGARA